MRPFVRDSRMPRLIFGDGALEKVGFEAARLGAERAMLICGESHPDVRRRMETSLAGRLAGSWTEIRQHVPVAIAERAAARSRELGADLLVTAGGGSAVGLGKAVALRTRLPLLAVPTTYSGSEMTVVWGQSADGVKTTGRDPVVLPRTVLYDPRLLLDLPAAVVGPSGMNALAHCVEALYGPDADPLSSALAIEGARLVMKWLPAACGSRSRNGETGGQVPDLAGRTEVLWASCLAGHVLSTAGASLHHALCHLLGGRHDLPHAETHAAVLPYVVQFVLPACEERLAPLAAALDVALAGLPRLIWDVGQRVGAPSSGLGSLGLAEAAVPGVATELYRKSPTSPRPLSEDDAHELLRACWVGQPPRATTPGEPVDQSQQEQR